MDGEDVMVYARSLSRTSIMEVRRRLSSHQSLRAHPTGTTPARLAPSYQSTDRPAAQLPQLLHQHPPRLSLLTSTTLLVSLRPLQLSNQPRY